MSSEWARNTIARFSAQPLARVRRACPPGGDVQRAEEPADGGRGSRRVEEAGLRRRHAWQVGHHPPWVGVSTGGARVSRSPLHGAKSTACMDTDPVHARPAWQVEGNASRRSHRPRERMTPVDTRSSVRWLVASATLSGRVPGSAHSPRARPSVGGRRWHRGRPGPVEGSRRRGRRPGPRRSRARRGRPGTGIGRGRRAGG